MKLSNCPPNPATSILIMPLTLDQAFAAVKPEIDALPNDRVLKVNVDVPHATAMAMGAVEGLNELLPALGTLPDYDLRPVRLIGTYAGAALHTHLLAMQPTPRDPQLPGMLQEAARLRGDLRTVAEALGRFELLDSDRVRACRTGRGRLQLANDLCALATLYNERWAELESRVPITRAMIERAAMLGAELHAALGHRRLVAASDGEGAERRRMRARAFTLFVRAYAHCRRGVSFLRCPHGDVDRYVPSLYPRRKRSVVRSLENREIRTDTEPSATGTLEIRLSA